MNKLPKSIINKFERCHNHQSKSDKIYMEIQEWFIQNCGEECTYGDFNRMMNDIQSCGITDASLKLLLESINETLLEEEWLKNQKSKIPIERRI